MAQSISQAMRIMSKEESKEMMAVWPDVVRDIVDGIRDVNIPSIDKWMEKVLQYNVPRGKKVRGLALIYAYKMLTPNDELTVDTIRLARILAWCVELLEASLLLLDDVIDRSQFRRGQPCWYRCNDLGVFAVNDSILLDNAMYYILRKYFKGKDCYIDLLQTFQDIIFKTAMGQCLEFFLTNFSKKPTLDLYTTNTYNSIIEYKTAYYTFVLPVTAAMYLAGIKDPETFRQAITILLEIGRFYQVQDDYLSCFGELEVCGKDDTDVQDGKCTWFIVQALQRATPEQRKILEECYGVSDPEKVKQVKQLFTDLNLLDAYLTYEKETYNQINVHIQQLSCGLPHNLFSDLLEQIYHRIS